MRGFFTSPSRADDSFIPFKSATAITLNNIKLTCSMSRSPSISESQSTGAISNITLDISNYNTLKLSDFTISDQGGWTASTFKITANDGTVIMSESLKGSTNSYAGGTYDISAYEEITLFLDANIAESGVWNYTSYITINSITIE